MPWNPRKYMRSAINLTLIAFAASDVSWAGFNRTYSPKANYLLYVVFLLRFQIKALNMVEETQPDKGHGLSDKDTDLHRLDEFCRAWWGLPVYHDKECLAELAFKALLGTSETKDEELE